MTGTGTLASSKNVVASAPSSAMSLAAWRRLWAGTIWAWCFLIARRCQIAHQLSEVHLFRIDRTQPQSARSCGQRSGA
jgi:hypothetical protein